MTTRLSADSNFRQYRGGMINACEELATESHDAVDLASVSLADCKIIAANFDIVGMGDRGALDEIGGKIKSAASIKIADGDTANVRRGPTKWSLKRTELPNGFRVQSLGITDGWHRVRFIKDGQNYGSDEEQAFVESRYIQYEYSEDKASGDPYSEIRPSGVYRNGEEKCETVLMAGLKAAYAVDIPSWLDPKRAILNALPGSHKVIASDSKLTSRSDSWRKVVYVLDGVIYGLDTPHWIDLSQIKCPIPSP